MRRKIVSFPYFEMLGSLLPVIDEERNYNRVKKKQILSYYNNVAEIHYILIC